jgi:hypothetical protein
MVLGGRAVSLFTLSMRGGLATGSLITRLVVNRFGVRAALLVDGLSAIVCLVYISRGWVCRGAPAGETTAFKG